MKVFRVLVVTAMVAGAAALMAPLSASASGASSTPRWIRHIQRYPGGISAGVRAMVSPAAAAARAKYGNAPRTARPTGVDRVGANNNVQMNDDSNPPMPQDETAVAYSSLDPQVAVAGANDYVSGGVDIMYTSDGGVTWGNTRVTPFFNGTGDYCTGGDPGIAYSQRDDAFYMTQLCFFRSLPYSEVQLYKSTDGGKTWNGGDPAIAASNFDYSNGTVDDSIFNDKELVVVDNNPGSAHYGRIYVTYTKFHVMPSGFSDYCPIQLSYTDSVPVDPFFTVFTHVSVVPDDPGGPGTNGSANQGSDPVVEKNGTLDISYAQEDCNSGLDFHILLQKSADGGNTFLANAVRADRPGEFVDNPNLDDTLPPTFFRAPLMPSLNYNRASGTLALVYQNNVTRSTSGADISVSLSHNGGLTWGHSRVLSTNGQGQPARNDQFFAWISSTESGQFIAIWSDRRKDPNNHNIAEWEARSSDDGKTWKSAQIGKAWNPNFSFFGCGCFIGDYAGVAASDTVAYPVWTDGRDSAFHETGIGETDIFTNITVL